MAVRRGQYTDEKSIVSAPVGNYTTSQSSAPSKPNPTLSPAWPSSLPSSFPSTTLPPRPPPPPLPPSVQILAPTQPGSHHTTAAPTSNYSQSRHSPNHPPPWPPSSPGADSKTWNPPPSHPGPPRFGPAPLPPVPHAYLPLSTQSRSMPHRPPPSSFSHPPQAYPASSHHPMHPHYVGPTPPPPPPPPPPPQEQQQQTWKTPEPSIWWKMTSDPTRLLKYGGGALAAAIAYAAITNYASADGLLYQTPYKEHAMYMDKYLAALVVRASVYKSYNEPAYKLLFNSVDQLLQHESGIEDFGAIDGDKSAMAMYLETIDTALVELGLSIRDADKQHDFAVLKYQIEMQLQRHNRNILRMTATLSDFIPSFSNDSDIWTNAPLDNTSSQSTLPTAATAITATSS